ncbi:serine hydrolase domain-containing protein [Actinotalea fermentans]|uniref:serine hydrolase domain-containing protein n=1 Tax=Actinotalea fermentans TaxID=43671 RepID=UPI0011BE000B|nr:serine hydrolase [Actinotalea fermentans]
MPGRRRLPRALPSEQGVPARALLRFLDSLEQGGPELHSLMVLRRGHVIAEGWWHPYRRELGHQLFSLSKSFTSTAVGFARAEGLLSLDDLVLDHLGDLAPARPDPRLARMRIRHLLTMTTGHVTATDVRVFGTPRWAKAFLALPLEAEPGTEFLYNTPATYLLSFLVQRLTGQRVLEYLRPRLLAPLGIEGATWEQSPEGVDTGGFGLTLATEDLACFGQLYLQDGVWEGTRVLPEGWVAEATARHTDSHILEPDWAQGYGYQFWRCQPPGIYRGDGAFGQFCVVMPEAQAVVVATSGTPHLQGVLERMWEHLVPALAGEQEVGADLEPAAEAELAARLAGLRIAPPSGDAVPAHTLAGRRIEVAGDAEVRAVVVGPEGLGTGEGTTVTLELADGGSRTLAVGAGQWAERAVRPRRGQGAFAGRVEDGPLPVVAAAAWTAPDACTVQVRPLQSPTCLTLDARVTDDAVTAHARLSVSFGRTDLGAVRGRVVEA